MINSVTIVGTLVADPEIRTTQNGNQSGFFRIAHNTGRKDQQGKYISIFLNCTLFGKQVQILKEHFAKRSLIGVTGRLTQRSYLNKQGFEIVVTEILADRIDFVGPKADAAANQGYIPDAPASEPVSQVPPTPQGSNLESLESIEDDLLGDF